MSELTVERPQTPKAMYWTGWVLSLLPVPLLVMSAVMKLRGAPEVVKGFADWPAGVATPIGITELICTALYLIPQTATLGAILLTGYLGGAVATHVRIGENIAAPIIFGVVVWLGLFLRDARLRAILPWRS